MFLPGLSGIADGSGDIGEGFGLAEPDRAHRIRHQSRNIRTSSLVAGCSQQVGEAFRQSQETRRTLRFNKTLPATAPGFSVGPLSHFC
jgi:hypothetical protein